jgi:chemotaxis protein MotB
MPMARRQLRSINIWPGFVDALTSLVLAFIFVLLIFVVAQFTLSEVLTGRDEALKRLNRQVAELAEMLNLERKANADLRISVAQLSAELQSSTLKRDTLASRLSELSTERDKLSEQLASANSRAESAAQETDKAKDERDAALQSIESDKAELDKEKKLSAEALQQVELLNRQIAALRDQLAAIEAALEASEAANKQKDVQIADLGTRLNAALASKVEELARYRSEFFGRLREILGNRQDISVVGDRFVFQSEVLFPTASAELNPQGEETLRRLASTLKEIAPSIPSQLNWILEVDGYTDKRPITTARFPSNWELSTARATAVVKFLAANGISPEHLSATGFGEFQAIDPAENEAAFAKNRRIEFKLTQR